MNRSFPGARIGVLAGIGATLVGEDAWPIGLARRQLAQAFGLAE
jgi:hypothetical protein